MTVKMANNDSADNIFVSGLDLEMAPRKGHMKKFHKKSRTGCQRCRSRRVKCNESKPVCRNCQRKGLPCIYDRDESYAESSSAQAARAGQGTMGSFLLAQPLPDAESNMFLSASEDGGSYLNHDSRSPESCVGEPQETRSRRMLELELMHFYVTETGPSVAFDTASSYHLFVKAIPRMALKSDALLYSLYAIATLHQTKTAINSVNDEWSIPSPGATETALERHQFYLQLAIDHHHRELASLSRYNVDAQMLTANLMRITALVMLSDRSLAPYTPPVEWMRITESNKPIFMAAWEMMGDDYSSETAKLIRATRVAWDEDERIGFNNIQGLQHLLPTIGDIDGYDAEEPEIRRAYESALGYIGGSWQALQRSEPLGPIARRLMLFPLLVDKGFIDLVGEARPRALVIMAHYFALLVVLEGFWFISMTGRREVKAIAAHLTPDWQRLIEWPLHIIDHGIPYAPISSPSHSI